MKQTTFEFADKHELPPREEKHTCHARGCSTVCFPEFLMCPRHWARVPRKLQTIVWRNYRDGQCDDKRPSREWHVAADAAIGFVAKLEGFSVRVCEEEALKTYGM